MKIPETIYSAAANKCPRCHEGKVFSHNNPYLFTHMLEMNKECDHCGLHYEKEPGFFYGAMYVSYALMAIVFFVWLVSDLLWIHSEPEVLFLYVLATILVLFPIVFRWSRIIWLNFFFKFDRNYKRKHQLQSTLK